MTRPDDSTPDPEDLRAVEEQAHRLLDHADAWHRYPVPVDDILFAARVRLAPTSAFEDAAIVSYIKGKASDTGARIKSAISKVFGLYDAAFPSQSTTSTGNDTNASRKRSTRPTTS